MRKIAINFENMTIQAALNESATAQAIWEALPLEGSANTWGDEIYFEIPVTVEQAADASQEVPVGTLGYWPVGRAFCIFFGPTPVSRGDLPRAYSPVNVFGHIEGDPAGLKAIADGARVTVAAV